MAKKPKMPKRPKRSSGIEVWKRYDQRVADWKRKCSKIETDKKTKERLIQKHLG